ncbi:unnamed protein product [Orchesella dallaii]|uniref:Uncharacterized protein n=1 Tax=Orchesella dallaii TaxID=48710 RepID=A0ABP1QBL2_9HEXA
MGMGEDGETYYDKSSTAKTQQTTAAFPAQVETKAVTGSVEAAAAAITTTKRSCDSKLENIIASKEFASNNTKTATTTETAVTAAVGESKAALVMLPTTSSSSSPPPPLLYSTKENEEMGKAEASLTLESLDKMNKEIEIRPLKQDMSRTEETEKVGSASGIEEQGAQAKVTNRSNPKTEQNGGSEAAALTSSFPSSSSSPSSTNESSTSSPVNEGTSLMRSQSKLASRKNFANDDSSGISMGGESSIRETCASKGKNNSRKKGKQSSSNKSNKNNKTKPEMNDSLNLLENDRDDKKKKQEEGENREEKEESKKSSSEDTSQDEQGSQNQMTSSSDSSQQTQETCSSSSTSSPQEAEGIHTSLLNSCSLTSQQNIGGEMNFPISSSSSSASKKPTDLTVQCPAANTNDDGQYEALQLQRSPSLANEPSSPDSLNTNQSVAGSEIAPGENLSMSESDLMNRTTSIDEVEEDLPQEAEYVVGSEQEEVSALSSHSFTSDAPSKNLTEIHTFLDDSPPATESEEMRVVDVEVNASLTTSHENLSTNVAEVPGTELTICHEVELESGEKSTVTPASEEADDASPEEPIKSTANNTVTPSPPPPYTSENGERDAEEVPLRPQSITLAVTEWLKTQGENALTPIIPRASSSDEFEGDVEETTDSDDDDEDHKEEEDDGDGRVRGNKRDDKASNLEQNQKNVYGNPWVAPSNKSGSSITSKVAATNRRRSGSKKSAMKENEGNRATGLPKSDGVCSRVAPLLSSDKPLSSLTTTSLDRNCINNNKYSPKSAHMSSTCSTTTSDDQDENYVTARDAAPEPTTNKRDKHCNSNCKATTPSTSSISYLEVTFKTAERDVGKDYDSGLELSSPENFSSSSSASNTKANNNNATTMTNMNATYKSKELADAPSASIIISASAASTSIKEKKCERPALPKLITNHHHNKFTSPNPDQIVIAAPLSIQQDSAAAFTITGTNERSDYEPEKSDLSSSSTRNNTAPTSPSSSSAISGVNALASPASLPSSSIDERDHAEICDPQKYAKYYQFGVVFDTSDDPDQGIDTAAEEEETDSLDDITLDSPSSSSAPSTTITTTAPIMGPEQKQHQQQKFHQTQQKNMDAFLGTQRSKKVAKKGRKTISLGEEEKHSDVLVSKSVYLPDDEEEIGTFDPKLVLESRLRRASSGGGGGKASDSFDSTAVDALDYVGETALVATPITSTSSDAPSSHLYVNPLSLAAEMSGSELVKVGVGKNESAEESSSFDSLDEPPLPPYESPPSVEIPVYNTNTPAARVIRQNFYAIGDPVSGAICCSIQ